ncbi:hypothetical protein AHMF7605_11950 [Adhaeribacter arboris]|uniref:Uncharacterized protein n=1 Tax=Adhaeribacter arboris TaxID=2072846 RepID=A0A2T2YFA6_9BACT|nr:hypothetical protein [Adhaeribacter arboris]PSR54184.1 hypothetical protein AHMF7605_11950 [Adhaeribacter arboris]
MARKVYPGTKRGEEVEWLNLQKKFKNQLPDLPRLILGAIEKQIQWRERMREVNPREFVPQWPHFKTYINQQRWTEETPEVNKVTFQNSYENRTNQNQRSRLDTEEAVAIARMLAAK